MINCRCSQQRNSCIGMVMLIILFTVYVESRPFELDMNPNGAFDFEPYQPEADPAFIMLKHIWKSVQQIKRRHREIEDDTGSAVAQQLEVLRRINRRQVMEQRLRAEVEEPEIGLIFDVMQDNSDESLTTRVKPTAPPLLEKMTNTTVANLNENNSTNYVV